MGTMSMRCYAWAWWGRSAVSKGCTTRNCRWKSIAWRTKVFCNDKDGRVTRTTPFWVISAFDEARVIGRWGKRWGSRSRFNGACWLWWGDRCGIRCWWVREKRPEFEAEGCRKIFHPIPKYDYLYTSRIFILEYKNHIT